LGGAFKVGKTALQRIFGWIKKLFFADIVVTTKYSLQCLMSAEESFTNWVMLQQFWIHFLQTQFDSLNFWNK